MKRALAVLFAAAAIIVATAPLAAADPAPGGNNPAYVCNGNNADPPPCPGH